MAKRVSADTITQITAAANFREQPLASPPPTIEELTDKIRDRLAKEVFAAKAYLDAADPENERTVEARKKDLAQATVNQKMFEELISDVPKGFRLVPTFYSRITTEENDAIKQEYSFSVRPRFLKFVGENYADDLRALGIAEEGIERMKNGLDPQNDKGEKYNLNVDHIIERAGSGMMGKTKSVDPDSPMSKPSFDINHFGNFVLLPEPVHEYKNKLNDLQLASDMPFKKGKWILMMVPERNDAHHGFVAQPQPANSKLKGVLGSPPGLNHSRYVVDVTLGELSEMKNTGAIRQTVRELINTAHAEGSTVADMAEAEARQKKPGLRAKFNAAVAGDAKSDFIVNGLVRPAIADVTYTVSHLFRRVSRDMSDKRKEDAFHEFTRFFRSQQMKDLRMDVEALPVPEAAEMGRVFQQMEQDIKRIADRLDAAAKLRNAANPNFKPGNDNAAPKKPFKKKFNKGGNNGGGNNGARIRTPGSR